jgi:glycosyltransferase involved in cell wall biosynthesis
MTQLVSIIIPNYNRESLIGETLDSILAQTYSHWECIIVDDGSTDNSVEVIQQYVKKDLRFKLIQRPSNHLKGANACRNIGLQKAKGEFIIFFDSDDLMMEQHVENKLKFMIDEDLDYAVFKSKNFAHPIDVEEELDYSYYNKYEFTADNYLLNNLRFFTNDLIVKSALAKKCEFYFKYKADIENVLMTQLVLLSTKNGFKDENVTLKRYHDANITQSLEGDKDKGLKHLFFYYYNILDYIYDLNASPKAKQFILNQLVHNYRKINFGLEVSFFDFFWKIFKFKKPSILLGIVVHRLKK